MNKEREAMIKAAKEHVTNALNGKAHKIVCLQSPCAIVWAESIESGAIRWTTPTNVPEWNKAR